MRQQFFISLARWEKVWLKHISVVPAYGKIRRGDCNAKNLYGSEWASDVFLKQALSSKVFSSYWSFDQICISGQITVGLKYCLHVFSLKFHSNSTQNIDSCYMIVIPDKISKLWEKATTTKTANFVVVEICSRKRIERICKKTRQPQMPLGTYVQLLRRTMNVQFGPIDCAIFHFRIKAVGVHWHLSRNHTIPHTTDICTVRFERFNNMNGWYRKLGNVYRWLFRTFAANNCELARIELAEWFC